MPGQINRQPLGLLGFLGIKNGGQYPIELLGGLASTWDMADLYLNAAAEHQTVGSAALALGSTTLFTPPQGEIWYVTAYSAFVNTAAASTLTVNLCVFGQLPAQAVMLGESVSLTAVQARQLHLARPILLAPGESLGLSVSDATGSATRTGSLRYTRLDM